MTQLAGGVAQQIVSTELAHVPGREPPSLRRTQRLTGAPDLVPDAAGRPAKDDREFF